MGQYQCPAPLYSEACFGFELGLSCEELILNQSQPKLAVTAI